jgi:hypothetical protein
MIFALRKFLATLPLMGLAVLMLPGCTSTSLQEEVTISGAPIREDTPITCSEGDWQCIIEMRLQSMGM